MSIPLTFSLLAFFFCNLLLYFHFPAVAFADAPATGGEVNSFRIKIRRLQQGISRQESEIEQNEIEEQSVLSEIEEIDNRLGEQQQRLSELTAKMKQQQDLIDREEVALQKLRKEKNIVESHLKKRISAYYTMGDIGLLNVTFSTKTLPELLSFHDSFDALIKYDQDVIKVYIETIEELERVKNALDLEKTVLQEFILQNEHELEILEQTKQEKKYLLTSVRTQTQLHRKAAEEMRKASNELTESLVSIKTQYQPKKKTFETAKGNLPPPVDGVLSTLYHQEKTNKLGVTRTSEGIELQAPEGTPVLAVDEGTVIFAGYLRGYGNTVIIHHGFQYYTVTSRIEGISVSKGQHVSKESTIGVIGITATLFDEGLYFEIRHGKETLDPLEWLNPNRLSTVHESSTPHGDVEQLIQEE